MIDTLGADVFFGLLTIAALYLAATTSPIWVPAVIVIRNRRNFSRPWLFVGVIACLAYGLLFLLFFVLYLPFVMYAIYVAPQLEAAGLNPGKAILAILEFTATYNWFIGPGILLATSIFTTKKVKGRWNGICNALAR